MMPGDLASQKRPRRADQHLDLPPGLPFRKGAVHIAKRRFEGPVLTPAAFARFSFSPTLATSGSVYVHHGTFA